MEYFVTENINNVIVIRLVFNEIGFQEREELKKQLVALVAKDGGNFVVNLAKIGFLSSLVIATLISFMKAVHENGGTIRLCEASESAAYALQVTRMDQAFSVYDAEKEAVESV